jgi:hypothetical protein
MALSSKRTTSKDVQLYGKASAAAYLGISEAWLEQLVRRGLIRYWQEQPSVTREDDMGNKITTHGSPLVFQQHWLDAYQAAPKGKPGWPKGKPRKSKPQKPG